VVQEPLDDLPVDKAHEMMEQARDLRSLVRIKIEDDNDLKLVRQALRESDSFFKDLRAFRYQLLDNKGITELELLCAIRDCQCF